MTKSLRSTRHAARKPGTFIFTLTAMSLLLLLAWITPLSATQRMVLAEEYTNSG